MHREQLRMEQEWRARMEREVGARPNYQYQAMSVGQIHVHPAPVPQQLQAHGRPRDALAQAASLVEGLRELPQNARDAVVRAIEDSLQRR